MCMRIFSFLLWTLKTTVLCIRDNMIKHISFDNQQFHPFQPLCKAKRINLLLFEISFVKYILKLAPTLFSGV